MMPLKGGQDGSPTACGTFVLAYSAARAVSLETVAACSVRESGVCSPGSSRTSGGSKALRCQQPVRGETRRRVRRGAGLAQTRPRGCWVGGWARTVEQMPRGHRRRRVGRRRQRRKRVTPALVATRAAGARGAAQHRLQKARRLAGRVLPEGEARARGVAGARGAALVDGAQHQLRRVVAWVAGLLLQVALRRARGRADAAGTAVAQQGVALCLGEQLHGGGGGVGQLLQRPLPLAAAAVRCHQHELEPVHAPHRRALRRLVDPICRQPSAGIRSDFSARAFVGRTDRSEDRSRKRRLSVSVAHSRCQCAATSRWRAAPPSSPRRPGAASLPARAAAARARPRRSAASPRRGSGRCSGCLARRRACPPSRGTPCRACPPPVVAATVGSAARGERVGRARRCSRTQIEHFEPRKGQLLWPVVEHSVVGPPLSVVTIHSVSCSMLDSRSAAVTFSTPSSRADSMPANCRRCRSAIVSLYLS